MVKTLTHDGLEKVKRDLFQALQSKYSLQYYLRLAYDAMQMPLSLCDTSFGVLAAVPSAVILDRENVETIDGRQYIKFPVTQELDQKQHLSHIREDRRPYVSRDNKFPYEIAFQAVRVNRAVVAYLFCPGRPEGFMPEDLELIDYLSQVLSIEMQKTETFAVESGLQYEYYLQELISGHFSTDEFAAQRLRRLKRRPQPYYFMLFFTFDDPESRHAATGRYYEQLLSIFPEGLVGVVSGRLCMLLPREEAHPFTERERISLLNFLEFNRMYCGVSYYYTALTRSAFAMEQAEAAVQSSAGGERICSYEREFLNCLFSKGLSQSWLEAQIYPDLRLLHQYDRAHRSEFIYTLRTYIVCSRNAARTAEALHIHKSTLFYRLGKIGELLGVDIFDGKRLFAYEFSFHLIDYLSRNDAPDAIDLGLRPESIRQMSENSNK